MARLRWGKKLANLLLAIGPPGAASKTREAFRSGIALTELIKGDLPSLTHEAASACVASYTRRNGSGTPVTIDPATGDWLVAVGTWFHDAGFKSGDEAQLLARFGAVGADTLATELDGFFVIAAGQAATGAVTVITDTVGALHCYVRTLDDVVVLSTSSMVLASLADFTIDSVAIQEFLQTAAMYEDRTFYREVRKLAPATCYRFGGTARNSANRYWHVTDLKPDSRDGAGAVTDFATVSLQIAKNIAATYPRVSVDLTGGYDSRVTVAAFIAAGMPISTAVGGPPQSADVTVSTALAAKLGIAHHFMSPGPVQQLEQLQRALQLTDGEYDIVDYARIQDVQGGLAKSFDVNVNGYSGEIGRGYGWEVLVPNTGDRRPLDVAKVAARRFVNPSYDATLVPVAERIEPAEHFREAIARIVAGLGDLPNTLQYDYCMTMLRCQRWYGRIASSTDQIYPCLSFFLQRSIITPMLETNTRSRANSLLVRRYLAATNPTLAHHPLAAGYPPVPATLTTFYRFWPLLPYYGSKAVGRLQRRFFPRAVPTADVTKSPRLQLWADPAIRELLRPERMETARFLSASGLESFLAASQAPNAPQFRGSDQWSLLLTLECALKRIATVRAQIRSGAGIAR